MTLFSKLRQSLGGAARKSAPSGGWPGHPPHAAWLPYGGPWRGTRSWHHLVREGYENNVIVHRSVRLVAECAASIPVLALRDGARLEAHPLLDLLAAPSPMQCGAELLERLHAFLALAGNAFVERVDGPDGTPAELHVLRPDRVRVLPGPDGWPAAYEVRADELVRRIPVEPASGRSALLHLRTFHPLDDHHGLSALTAAAAGIEVHNAASGWNRALLENAARPSGALVFEPRDAGAPDALTEEQVARLRAEMEAQFQGPGNAGRPLLLEGGLRWQAMGFSPADMDFINAKHVAAREIALAFGVPPMLLGIPGDNTFANYQEANRALWRLTLLPQVDKVLAGLGGWLGEAFGDAVTLAADRDTLPALASEREALWARLGAAAFLTPNEKRAAVGLDPVEGGDGLAPTRAEGAPPRPFDLRGQIAVGRERKGRAIQATRAARFADLMRDFEAAKAGGKTHKIWRTVGDDDVRGSHAGMDRVRIGIDDSFDVGGETLFLPSDPDATFAETANCRCFVEYAVEGVGETGEEEESFDDIRSVELATRVARLRGKYGVGLNDTFRSYTQEDLEKGFGGKLSESEVIRNIEDFEAELDRTRALGSARGKDWALERLRGTGTNLGNREPKDPEGENSLGLVGTLDAGAGLIEQTIVFKPELDEDDVRGLAARGFPAPSTMFAREAERTPAAAKRYTIRHELGHALQNAKGPISPVLSRLKVSAGRKLSRRAAEDEKELVAELIAWYTSPDYDGNLAAEVEAVLDELLR